MSDSEHRGSRRREHGPRPLALVALGGFVGAPLRYAVAQALPGPASGWPTATFVTNLAGALALGLLLAWLAEAGDDTGRRRALRLALGTGVIGAFTTYSTLVVEVDDLARAGHLGMAAGYGLASAAGGVLCAGIGLALGGLRGGRGRRRARASA